MRATITLQADTSALEAGIQYAKHLFEIGEIEAMMAVLRSAPIMVRCGNHPAIRVKPFEEYDLTELFRTIERDCRINGATVDRDETER